MKKFTKLALVAMTVLGLGAGFSNNTAQAAKKDQNAKMTYNMKTKAKRIQVINWDPFFNNYNKNGKYIGCDVKKNELYYGGGVMTGGDSVNKLMKKHGHKFVKGVGNLYSDIKSLSAPTIYTATADVPIYAHAKKIWTKNHAITHDPTDYKDSKASVSPIPTGYLEKGHSVGLLLQGFLNHGNTITFKGVKYYMITQGGNNPGEKDLSDSDKCSNLQYIKVSDWKHHFKKGGKLYLNNGEYLTNKAAHFTRASRHDNMYVPNRKVYYDVK